MGRTSPQGPGPGFLRSPYSPPNHPTGSGPPSSRKDAASSSREPQTGLLQPGSPAPKTVSLAALLDPGHPGAEQVMQCHTRAVEAVCGSIGRMIAPQRRETPKIVQWVGVTFHHTHSREREPHLHTHLAVPNIRQERGRTKEGCPGSARREESKSPGLHLCSRIVPPAPPLWPGTRDCHPAQCLARNPLSATARQSLQHRKNGGSGCIQGRREPDEAETRSGAASRNSLALPLARARRSGGFATSAANRRRHAETQTPGVRQSRAPQ